jgi:hypothetical protein
VATDAVDQATRWMHDAHLGDLLLVDVFDSEALGLVVVILAVGTACRSLPESVDLGAFIVGALVVAPVALVEGGVSALVLGKLLGRHVRPRLGEGGGERLVAM